MHAFISYSTFCNARFIIFPHSEMRRMKCDKSIWYDYVRPYVFYALDIVIAASWWRHQMEIFSALLALCVGNSPVLVKSPHKGQWRGALVFSLICTRINGWVNNDEAGDLRRNHAHYDVTVMFMKWIECNIALQFEYTVLHELYVLLFRHILCRVLNIVWQWRSCRI